MLKPKQKAEYLVEKFESLIGHSDFHIPEFISGVPIANGSKEYEKVLFNETRSLAKQCALICIDEYCEQVKAEIEKL